MTTTVKPSFSRDYMAHLVCTDFDGWLAAATDQVATWLREKSFDVNLDESGDYRLDHSTLSVRRAPAGVANDFRMFLREKNAGGTWVTELLIHDADGSRGWINLTVSNAEGKFVDVPRLAGYLMHVLRLSKGPMELTPDRRWFGSERVPELIALLADPSRHGLVFVAGTTAEDRIPADAFGRQVGKWGKQVYGLAEVIVLDPAATKEFAQRVGTRFEAPKWTIRTYKPGVHFDDPDDARRHRILGTERLGLDDEWRIQRLLGDVARTQAATAPDDPEVLSVRRRFERLENRRLVESVAPAATEAPSDTHVDTHPLPTTDTPPPPPREVDAGHAPEPAELSLVKRILGIAKITEQALRDIFTRASRPDVDKAALEALDRRVDELQDSLEQAQDTNQELREALEDAQLELEITHLDLDKSTSRIAWLQTKLKDKGDYETPYADVPAQFQSSPPANFAEFLSRLESIPSVEFTGDKHEVEKLNQIDTNNAALRTAWAAVLALSDYARARADGDCDKGFDHYIRHTPEGYRTFPPGKFAETETAATMRGYGDQRVFPVPESVHSREKVEMKAHFKLARIGLASPRMHIYDAHPETPKVYIGYLGTHLDNTQTN